MSKERELLEKFCSSSLTYSDWLLLKVEAEEMLAQHEQEVKKQQLIEKYTIFLRGLLENNGEGLARLKAHDIEVYNRLKDIFS